MHRLVVLAWLGGCAHDGAPPQLVLEGDLHVEVDALGPVPAPRAELDDGSRPEGLTWSLSAPGVAEIREGRVIATAPGETRITGSWQDQEVAWTLVVDPLLLLTWTEPPAAVEVGATVPLVVAGSASGVAVDPGPVSWSSSDDAILVVEEGTARGIAPGVVYVTARAQGSQAMLELEVLAAP